MYDITPMEENFKAEALIDLGILNEFSFISVLNLKGVHKIWFLYEFF